jgi:hypothetical protein
MERAWPKDLADHQFLGTNGTVDLVPPLTGFENPAADIHSATDSPSVPPSDSLSGTYQRLSQLLAKPEVGGYLVMGTLIACSFFV